AAGKSEVAALLAKKIGGEVISCDSMQIYKGMDILTSKPGKALFKKVPHHLIGALPVSGEYNVSRYRKDALAKINGIIKRGKIPVFAGGTGLYMSILVDGIFRIHKIDRKIRENLYKLAKERGNKYLHEMLQRKDPEAADKIHPNDTKRIIRALEVFKATGKPISLLQKTRKGIAGDHDVKIFCLNLPREKLYDRINRRVELMFKNGLVKEVSLLKRHKLSRTARFAIGLNEVNGFLAGEYDLNTAKEMMKRNTRLYAKRQLTWFRRDKRINWIELTGKERAKVIVDRLWKECF
ncbi:MAG: tRNA (adenosine(37)-N6)-dimethylallyltransferase MiaA, partial [Candidatus Omnitrophica bacterium]|nr:tRNA (adenosine(37)-N6)-dimethylallyltransferase MiaA [Candidatus Omnitrophota bacterium]